MKLYPPELPQQLDFEHIRQQLAELCHTRPAKERCLQLLPQKEALELRASLRETDEILALFLRDENFPIAEHPPLEEFLSKLLVPGHLLEPREFHAVRSTCHNFAALYRFVGKKKEALPSLWKKIEPHPPEPYITQEISRVLDDQGMLRSQASQLLASLRKEISQSRAAADRIFSRVLKKVQAKGYLADFEESVSENRRVLAVQAGYKGQVQGIFHGSSSRQSIAFIEPGETVEVNNRIAELIDEEQREIQRILRELASQLQPYEPIIREFTSLIHFLDFTRAKARWARREDACVPQLSEKPLLHLREAYNPVLRHFNRLKDKSTVPLSLELNSEQRILVISGPNAGGKSLSLKTAGLLQLMLQSGLPVPVHPDSQMYLFEQLMGDIGDAQSIENELSTYSSKLQKMQHFLQYADDRTLLLIDEFGSGSDPDLGSALAQVFLDKLCSFGLTGIFTTHFNAIKAQAAKTPGVENGAMLFDKDNFEPRYILQSGKPGSSFTFEVALKSGLPRHIVEEGRQNVDQNTLAVDQLLVQIQEDQLALENIRNRQEKEVKQLETLQNQQRGKIDELEEKLNRQGKVNEENNRLLYWGQRFQKLLESWRKDPGKKGKKEIVARFIALLEQQGAVAQKDDARALKKQQQEHSKKMQGYLKEKLEPGQKVRVLESNLKGSLLEKKGDKYLIELGGNMTTLLAREKFVRADAPVGPQAPKGKKRKSGKNTTSKNKGASQKRPADKKEKPGKKPDHLAKAPPPKSKDAPPKQPKNKKGGS